MKSFSILGGKVHVVELPDGAQGFGITANNDLGWYIPKWNNKAQDWDWDGDVVNLPAGNWQIVGRLSEVTESEAAGIVEYTGIWLPLSGKYECYMDYVTHGDCKTAIQSLESAILAEGYSFINPLGKSKEYKKKYTGHDMFFADYMQKWQEAQQRILSRDRALILRRVND